MLFHQKVKFRKIIGLCIIQDSLRNDLAEEGSAASKSSSTHLARHTDLKPF